MAGPFIVDKEHQKSANIISTALQDLYDLLSDYAKELSSISANNYVEGKTGNAIDTYASQVISLRNTLALIDMYHAEACQCFLIDVETTDHEL